MAAVSGPIQSSSVFVDTYTATIYPINSEAVLLTSAQVVSIDTTDDSSIVLRPVTPSDSYTVRVKVLSDGPAVVRVMEGVCCVNGVRCDPSDTRQELNNGSFIELGSSYRLQYKATFPDKPHPLRLLPPTPGADTPSSPDPLSADVISPGVIEADGAAPEMGVSSEVGLFFDLSVGKRPALASGSFSGSVECANMDEGLRTRLKRIAKEVTTRDQVHKNRRPPPPYEQVANSINYQLLHHTHPRVTTQLIDSLYGALKEMELKDPGLSKDYSSFLSSYSTARGQSATPTCMMPADIPVVRFLTDMMMHICCMPDMTPLARKICPLWMDILSILSTSRPNQEALVGVNGGSTILSLMHLSVMREEVGFQERGWIILGRIVDSPTPPGRKPVILDASLSLVLSLVSNQLSVYHSHLPLVTALLFTLARLATVAKQAVSCEIASLPEDAFPTYTPLQGAHVLSVLREHNVLGHMMRVPPPLRTHPHFHEHYCLLIKALHLIKVRKTVCHDATPLPPTTPTKPPPKPARARKLRRSTIATSSESHKEAATPPPGHMTADDTASSKRKGLRPYSQSVSALNQIGSSERVFHPLLPTEEESVLEGDHVTSSDSHVTSVNSAVSSKESKKDGHVMNGENHVITTVVTEECHVINVPVNHQQNESIEAAGNGHVTITDVSANTPGDHVTITDVSANTPGDHVTITDVSANTPGDHVTITDVSANTPGDHVTITDVSANTPGGHVTITDVSANAPGDHVTITDVSANTPGGHVTILAEQEKAEDINPVSTATSPDQSDHFSSQHSDTLARDVQSLLDSLRAPLPSVAVEGRGRCNSHYFRHSVKRRSRKEVVREVGVVREPEVLVEDREEREEAGGQSSSRMQWGEAPPPLFLKSDSLSLFEVSGEVLSPSHTLLEEVVSGHSDIINTLGERAELLEGVLTLWREDKGLQAMTNTIQGCFSEESSDIPLFMDALNCFLCYKGPWTLAVCCVLLPSLNQVLSTQRDNSCVLTVVEVLLSVVRRFSELILACRGRSRSKRLSHSIDRQQQVLCYQQLHAIRTVIEERLDMNFDPSDVSDKLRKIHAALKPYKNELNDS